MYSKAGELEVIRHVYPVAICGTFGIELGTNSTPTIAALEEVHTNYFFIHLSPGRLYIRTGRMRIKPDHVSGTV